MGGAISIICNSLDTAESLEVQLWHVKLDKVDEWPKRRSYIDTVRLLRYSI